MADDRPDRSVQRATGEAAGPLDAAALPPEVRSLAVAPALVEAGIDGAAADRLAYIVDQVYFVGAERTQRLRRFFVLIVLSTMIAGFGLLADSVAVVIGAMLVAPLMTPILGTAVSLVLTEEGRLAGSIQTVLAGAGTAIAVGWVIAFLAAGAIGADNLPGEVASRTAPGLLDLGIAVSAGLAGGYLMVDRQAAAGAAGVAIAVALVPPLATVGICLELGLWGLAAGGLLLFGTNLVAIVFAASAVLLVARLLPDGFLRVRFRRLRAGFAAVLVAVVAISVPLALHTQRVIQQDQFERTVARAVATWDPRAVLSSVESTPGPTWGVAVQVASPSQERSPAWRLADLISDASNRPVDLDLSYLTEEQDRAATR